MWIERQPFIETANGTLKIFTTRIPVREGTLFVYQNGVALDGWVHTSSTQITFATAPAVGVVLYWSGNTLANVSETIGLWTIQIFQEAYNLVDLPTAALRDAITRSDEQVQRTCTVAAYAEAVADDDSDEYKCLRWVIGDLARYYLVLNGVLTTPTSEIIETFSESRKQTRYFRNAAPGGNPMTEAAILGQAAAYWRDLTPSTAESWGTGRYIGIVSDEEADEETEGFE
jgi:hypothetical protein